MEKNKKEIDKALVAWAEVRRDEIKNTIGDQRSPQTMIPFLRQHRVSSNKFARFAGGLASYA